MITQHVLGQIGATHSDGEVRISIPLEARSQCTCRNSCSQVLVLVLYRVSLQRIVESSL